jgi:hypothetical protein
MHINKYCKKNVQLYQIQVYKNNKAFICQKKRIIKHFVKKKNKQIIPIMISRYLYIII